MGDLIPGGDHTPTQTLAKQGLTAVGGIAGGLILLIMGALPPVAGIVAGAVVGVIGVGAVLSGDKDDRKPGLAAAVAGGLSILSRIPFVRPLAGVLLGIGAVGLLAIGVWNGIKFLRELKNRS